MKHGINGVKALKTAEQMDDITESGKESKPDPYKDDTETTVNESGEVVEVTQEPLTDEEFAEVVAQVQGAPEDITFTVNEEIENVDLYISQAEGDFNRLQMLLQNTNNKEHEALLIQGLRTAFKAKGNKSVVIDLMEWSRKLSVLGREDQKAFLNYGTQFFRDAFLINYSLHELVHFRSENNFDLNKLAPFVNNENIQDLISLFENSRYHILRNANAKMIFAELGLQLTRLLNKPST